MPAEPKTKPTDASVADFIAAVENPVRRADAEVIRVMLEEVTGEKPVMWGPSIVGYGSYMSGSGPWPIIGFSPRKAQLVLYFMGGYAEQQALLARLGKHSTSVACLYVKKLADIDMTVLREMAERAVAEMRSKYPA